MQIRFVRWAALAALAIAVTGFSSRAEDWKGKPTPANFGFGALAGLGVIDSTGGFALMGTAARKLFQPGFVPDLNDTVWIEAEVGPMFTSGATAFMYSAHLRWDFEKDPIWTFYALGGLSGSITPASLGSHFELFPRFGAGALWTVSPLFQLRGELSHE